jgi:hypothetical protein
MDVETAKVLMEGLEGALSNFGSWIAFGMIISAWLKS